MAGIVVAALTLLVVVGFGGTGTAYALSSGPSCTISYGATQSPYNSATTMIDSYGGTTSCDKNVASIYAQSWLEDSNGNLADSGPYHTCTFCPSLGSHGKYGPVGNGTIWTVQYATNIYLSKAHWTNWDRVHCNVYDPDSSGNYHDLDCVYDDPFVADAVVSVTLEADDVPLAVGD